MQRMLRPPHRPVTAIFACSSALALLAATGALAQDMDEPVLVLNPVVITASGFQQTVRDAPASISVIPGERLQREQVRDLSDALRDVPGVATVGNANEGEISIRGLPGSYTLILVDGVRQGTRDSRPNGSGGIEQNFMPPAAMIERIEVLRGPASTLYGSDAVGGVINIITRKVSPVMTGGVTLGYSRQQHDEFGDTRQVSAWLNGPLSERIGYQIWGSTLNRDEDAIIDGTQGRDNTSFGGRLTFALDDENTFKLEGGRARIRNESNPGGSLAAGELPSFRDNRRDYVRLSHEGAYTWGDTLVSLQREWGQRIVTTDDVVNPRMPEIRNTVLDARATLPMGDHKLSLGGQYADARLTDQNPGLRDGMDREFSNWQAAIYGEDEWQVTDRFALTGGLRLDRHEQYGTHWSPRLYGVYGLSEALTLKGGVSTGFRAPELRQVAPGYAYTTGGGGCFYGPEAALPPGRSPCGVIAANPDLEPETSVNYEAALLYDNNADLALGATLFYTRLKNQVNNERVYNPDGSYARWSDDPNYTLFQFYNLDEATLKGVELTGTWQPVGPVTLTASYTYTHSKQETGDYAGLPLNRTPKHLASLRADWVTPVAGLSSWASGNYVGDQIAAGLRIGDAGNPITRDGAVVAREYKGYFTADIGVSYALTDNVALNGAIYNLFDEQGMPDDINDVVEGRRFFVSLSATF